jgi:hypothetical protein
MIVLKVIPSLDHKFRNEVQLIRLRKEIIEPEMPELTYTVIRTKVFMERMK